MYMQLAFSLSASQPGISWPDPVWLLEAERTFLVDLGGRFGGGGGGMGGGCLYCAGSGGDEWEKTPYSPIDLLIPA